MAKKLLYFVLLVQLNLIQKSEIGNPIFVLALCSLLVGSC